MFRLLLISLGIALGTVHLNPIFGQFYAEQSSEIPVFKNGEQLINPWSGGINAGQVSTIDVNQNGLEDIFVFDRSARKVLVFLNNGSGNPNTFEYSYAYSNAFPHLRNWALLRDFNCDGKKDIFTFNGVGGFRVYKNVSTEQSGLQFVLFEESIQSYYEFQFSQYFTQIYISSIDIPVVDDLDGDGDLDIMVMSLVGVLMEYHKNYSVEETGTCDSLMFRITNRCYGYFSESAFDNSIFLHDEALHNSLCPPGYNIANPGPTAPRPENDILEAPEDGGPRHEGTAILALDLNQQLPKELVLGDIGNTNLVALINSQTTSGMDSIIAFDINFPSNQNNTEPVDLPSFPAGYYEDMNNDGARDLIVCPNDEWAASNFNSVWYYRNEGEDDLPNFVLQQKDLFQQEMIEVGEGCAAFFLDYNQDGLMDLLVGNKGYFLSPGVYQSRLTLFENTGTANNPAFTFITDDFANLGSLNLGQGLHPTFGDIDGDGDIDMLLGSSSGRVYVFHNTAGSGNSVNFELSSQPILTDINDDEIDPGQYSTPQLFDLNRNGLQDLVMGERNGRVFFYQNVGSAGNPVFELVNSFLGEIETTEGFSTTGYSVVEFLEIEDTYYLLVGTESGKIHLYGNIDNNLEGTFTQISEQFLSIQNGIRSSVAVTDINNDGFHDLFAGNFGGGLLFFKGDTETGIGAIPSNDNNILVYPNPAAAHVFVKMKNGDSRARIVEFYNGIGQRVLTVDQTNPNDLIQIDALERGIYFIRASSEGKTLGVQKLIIL